VNIDIEGRENPACRLFFNDDMLPAK